MLRYDSGRAVVAPQSKPEEGIMKNFLFFAVASFVVVSSAVACATPGDNFADRPWLEGDCKWCQTGRSPASSEPPAWGLRESPACRLVKERIGRLHGRTVYQTRQVCG
jgi:hypothetical protein